MYDPALGRFLQPDSIIPGIGNSQNLNRFSYVGNRPISLNDPTRHKPSTDGENPPAPEHKGICLKRLGCSETIDWNLKWIKWNLFYAPKYNFKDLPSDMSSIASKLSKVAGFGTATIENWTGLKVKDAGKASFGIDVVTQLLKDSQRTDLSYHERLERAGLNGVEGLAISDISTSVATKASVGIVNPSLELAGATEQVWVVPVAIAATWVATYVATNVTLSWVASKVINPQFMPGGN